jgi:hypothetical protein
MAVTKMRRWRSNSKVSIECLAAAALLHTGVDVCGCVEMLSMVLIHLLASNAFRVCAAFAYVSADSSVTVLSAHTQHDNIMCLWASCMQ